jgi:hypothetical protein
VVVFLISYANFPDEVLVFVNEVGEPQLYVEKSRLFYYLLAFVMVMNALAIGINVFLENMNSSLITKSSTHISQIFFNMFFASSVYFIKILNSRENFDYSNFGYLIYVTGGLMILSILFTLGSKYIYKKSG